MIWARQAALPLPTDRVSPRPHHLDSPSTITLFWPTDKTRPQRTVSGSPLPIMAAVSSSLDSPGNLEAGGAIVPSREKRCVNAPVGA